jgi:UDP-2-acetamido-3-amino-2,3-dideoxy-glucuronate N-acetyltransferase
MAEDTYYIHPHAVVEDGVIIGGKTRIWAFAHVLGGARIGSECNICDHVFVEGKVRIGDRVTVKCGVYLWDGVTLENDVFIGPCAAFTNDLTPRSKCYPQQFLKTMVRVGASIGANATILPGLIIGIWAMVGAGAVVTKNVPDYALVMGNPARFVAWTCRCGKKLEERKSGLWECTCGMQYQLSGTDKLCLV